MAKVVLHIGTHKTATTTIQDTFWTNADLLATHGLIYPRVAPAPITGHHGLVADWGRLPAVYHLPQGSRAALAEIAATYAATDATVFLSSEEFSRGNPAAAVDFTELRRLLAPFDQIEVLCLLRPQWQFLQSVYLEVSKYRPPARPQRMVEPVIRSGLFEGLWVDYNGLLDQLDRAFAPEEITLIDFARATAAPGGVLGRVLRHLGVDLGPGRLTLINDGASNVSPMPLAAWAANTLSDPHKAPAWLVAEASQVIAAQFGPDTRTCLFTAPEFDRLLQHFDGRNAVLHQRRAAVQPDFALPAADPGEVTLFRNAIPGSFWVRMCRSLVASRPEGRQPPAP